MAQDTRKYSNLTRDEKRARNLAQVQQFSFGGAPGLSAAQRQLDWGMQAVAGIDKSERAKLGGLVDAKSRLKHNKQRIADEKAAASTSSTSSHFSCGSTSNKVPRALNPPPTN